MFHRDWDNFRAGSSSSTAGRRSRFYDFITMWYFTYVYYRTTRTSCCRVNLHWMTSNIQEGELLLNSYECLCILPASLCIVSAHSNIHCMSFSHIVSWDLSWTFLVSECCRTLKNIPLSRTSFLLSLSSVLPLFLYPSFPSIPLFFYPSFSSFFVFPITYSQHYGEYRASYI